MLNIIMVYCVVCLYHIYVDKKLGIMKSSLPPFSFLYLTLSSLFSLPFPFLPPSLLPSQPHPSSPFFFLFSPLPPLQYNKELLLLLKGLVLIPISVVNLLNWQLKWFKSKREICIWTWLMRHFTIKFLI